MIETCTSLIYPFIGTSLHFRHTIMDTMAFQIASLKIAYSTVYSGADQRNYQSFAQMANNVENISIRWHHVILQGHYNNLNGASNHRRLDCLLNRFFRCGSKKTSKFRVTGVTLWGEFTGDRWTPAQGPVTRKIFPFDDVIMTYHP